MAVTELTLVFIATLATLATVGMFLNFADRWTELLVTFAASLLWGVVGMSSFDVIVRDTSFATASEPIEPLVYLGFGFAGIIAIYGLHDLLVGVRDEASDADLEDLWG